METLSQDHHLKGDKEGKLKHPEVLPFVWTYLLKDETSPKSRGTCNEGKYYSRAITMADTYTSCVEQPVSCMFWSLAVLNGMTVIGADAGNTFTEADPPEDPLFLSIDDQYQKWRARHLKKPPIPKGYIILVQHTIQGHPESPHLWENISTISYRILVSKIQRMNAVSIRPKSDSTRFFFSDW